MEQQFVNKGYNIVNNDDIADIYIVNTCTVTNIAERKSRQMIRRAKQLNYNSILVVCGCYAEVAKKEIEGIDDVDLVINAKEKINIVDIVEKINKENYNNGTNNIIQGDNNEIYNIIQEENNDISGINTKKDDQEFIDFGAVTYTEKTRAVIKVQDGCNMFCSYCIIPYARGRIRSRKIDSVINEIEEIAKNGIKEVVITGIHIASYGKDWDDKQKIEIRLIDLLEKINAINGIERIRLGSLEPTIITQNFINRLTKLEKICDHFHLSLQSGCDDTLKRMNRKYTTSDFKKITDLLKNTYKNVSLTTDIIVGFPQETDKEFNETYDFLKNIDFYKMHIFKYSPRKGTPASKMDFQIDGNIKERRSRKLIELSNENENKHNEQYIGKQLKVLFEEYENGFFKGHTTNYIEVKVQGKQEQKNEFINKIRDVKIIKNEEETMELIGAI